MFRIKNSEMAKMSLLALLNALGVALGDISVSNDTEHVLSYEHTNTLPTLLFYLELLRYKKDNLVEVAYKALCLPDNPLSDDMEKPFTRLLWEQMLLTTLACSKEAVKFFREHWSDCRLYSKHSDYEDVKRMLAMIFPVNGENFKSALLTIVFFVEKMRFSLVLDILNDKKNIWTSQELDTVFKMGGVCTLITIKSPNGSSIPFRNLDNVILQCEDKEKLEVVWKHREEQWRNEWFIVLLTAAKRLNLNLINFTLLKISIDICKTDLRWMIAVLKRCSIDEGGFNKCVPLVEIVFSERAEMDTFIKHIIAQPYFDEDDEMTRRSMLYIEPRCEEQWEETKTRLSKLIC